MPYARSRWMRTHTAYRARGAEAGTETEHEDMEVEGDDASESDTDERDESDNSERSESDLGSAIESEEESDDDGWD